MAVKLKSLDAEAKRSFQLIAERKDAKSVTKFILDYGVITEKLMREETELIKSLSARYKQVKSSDFQNVARQSVSGLINAGKMDPTFSDCLVLWSALTLLCSYTQSDEDWALCIGTAGLAFTSCLLLVP